MIDVYTNTDSEEVFNVTQNKLPYSLDTNNITKVEIYVCQGLAQLVNASDRIISSETSDISWNADVLTVMLGHLNLKQGKYLAKVKFYNAVKPLGFVVQDLQLKVLC